jgi:hypothetical protein
MWNDTSGRADVAVLLGGAWHVWLGRNSRHTMIGRVDSPKPLHASLQPA